MKRILCIWLPNWPIQRLVVAQPELKSRTIVLYTRQARGKKVIACCRHARRLGVRRNMSLAEASVLLKSGTAESANTLSATSPATSPAPPFVAEYDATPDRSKLQHLAMLCEQFSPLVGLDNADHPEGLLLEITGLEHLLGEEACQVRRIAEWFTQHGYHARLAVAETVGAAWALAHHGHRLPEHPAVVYPLANRSAMIVASHATTSVVGQLSIAALRLSSDTLALLDQLGIEHVEQLLVLPRTSISSRFGHELGKRLDQAVGHQEEVITAYQAPISFQTEWILEHPTEQRAMIEKVLWHLLQHLTQLLYAQQQGALLVLCRIQSEQGLSFIDVGLFQPTACVEHLWSLLRMQLDGLRFRSAVHSMRLQAVTTAPLERQQYTLWSDPQRNNPQLLAQLIDRLSSRLGRRCVLKARLRASALPERAYRTDPFTLSATASSQSSSRPVGQTPRKTKDSAGSTTRLLAGQRPLQLFEHPVPVQLVSIVPDGPPVWFHFRGQKHHVHSFTGPERIETAWWEGNTIGRDYYRVETDGGYRLWIYRCLSNRGWFLHGLFQ